MASEKQVIILTEAASFQVKEMMVHNEEEHASLRVAVKGGGCSGLSYGMAFDNTVNEDDFTDNQHGIQILVSKEESGELSRRGLRADGTVFDEMVLDVNTNYFEEHGGYDYAVEFYKTAYEFAKEKYGEQNIVSAVMHADEINLAATELYGKPVYHYHMHIIAFPVVEKEILWSKRCKTPELRGTVKEVIRQISHAKKWDRDILLPVKCNWV